MIKKQDILDMFEGEIKTNSIYLAIAGDVYKICFKGDDIDDPIMVLNREKIDFRLSQEDLESWKYTTAYMAKQFTIYQIIGDDTDEVIMCVSHSNPNLFLGRDGFPKKLPNCTRLKTMPGMEFKFTS